MENNFKIIISKNYETIFFLQIVTDKNIVDKIQTQ